MVMLAQQRLTGCLADRGADEEDIVRLEHVLGVTLPASYRRFMLVSDGCDGTTGTLWIVLYPISEVAERTKQFEKVVGLRDVVQIGTDGGLEAYVIDYSPDGPRFGAIPFVGDGLADLAWSSPTLDDLVEALGRI